MDERFLPSGTSPPDFYIAAIGRSGSTMICNWLSQPPQRMVFVEPFFLRPENSPLLRIQLEEWSLGVSDDDWNVRQSESAQARFARLLKPRLTGRRWALKEVLAEEHRRVIDRLNPERLVICVRNIFDVALSFFEKHRLQDNLARFSDDWVMAYCLRESAALVRLREEAVASGLPCQVVRYEDFTKREGTRAQLERFVGWSGGGDLGSGLVAFGREFELRRHGPRISDDHRTGQERWLPERARDDLERLAQECAEYQKAFGYDIDLKEILTDAPFL